MKNLFKKIVIPLICTFTVVSCTKSNIPPPTPLEENPPQAVLTTVKWKTPTGNGNGGIGNYNLSPTVTDDNNTVIVPNQNGKVFAIDIDNGSVKWQENTEVKISSQPNTIANAVVFGSIKGDLIALDTDNGQTLWKTTAPSSLFSRPTIYDNSVYVYTHDGSISAYNAINSEQLWTEPNILPDLILPGNSSPIVLNNTVMIGSSYGTILGFTVDDGDRTINIPIAISQGSSPADRMVDIVSTPLLYGDYLIFSAYQGAIVGIDKDKGKMLWAKKASIINNIEINDNAIFTTQADSSIKAYDITTGDILWTQDILKWRDVTSPIYYKGMIVVGDYEGYLHFFNSINGQYLGRLRLTTPEDAYFTKGIKGELIPTEKGIVVEADNGDTYLVEAGSDAVIYTTILSDHVLDKGKSVSHIDPIVIESDEEESTEIISSGSSPKTTAPAKNVNVIIADLSPQKVNNEQN
ncbi:PQQ-binding-like beta-propeller repeat protein [Francisella frigiditurris]|uniref:Outer membrane protein assembly factor BamB n=1 Tax=Francisella frigiditurris TaxID=1542390 RepID=A0A1J0KSH9_9GAMM|nr:PQQ-binding-like beta-propeller repeat protein [Francisella frigiditurris]APC96588.1 PQQ enzyme repeat family protein [Francisella frigiditurris]